MFCPYLHFCDVKGRLYNSSAFRYVSNIAAANHLHHQVADCRTFRRPRNNLLTRVLFSELVQETILTAAADDVERVVRFSRNLFKSFKRDVVISCKVVIDYPTSVPCPPVPSPQQPARCSTPSAWASAAPSCTAATSARRPT